MWSAMQNAPAWCVARRTGGSAVCGGALHGDAEARRILSDWPLPYPRSWLQYVNQPQTEAELEAIRRSVRRRQQTVTHLGRRFHRAIGRPPSLAARAASSGKRWLHGISASRAVFS